MFPDASMARLSWRSIQSLLRLPAGRVWLCQLKEGEKNQVGYNRGAHSPFVRLDRQAERVGLRCSPGELWLAHGWLPSSELCESLGVCFVSFACLFVF